MKILSVIEYRGEQKKVNEAGQQVGERVLPSVGDSSPLFVCTQN